MITTLAHLFLLFLPGGVQETLPLPFFLRCHISVPVGFHVVHPLARMRVSRSFKRKRQKNVLSHDSLQTYVRLYVTTGEKLQGLERSRKKERREEPPKCFSRRETLDQRSICISSTCVRSVTATRVCTWEERGNWGLNKKRERERTRRAKSKGTIDHGN